MPNLNPSLLDRFLESLLAETPTDEVRKKLGTLHKACGTLATKGIRPTVPAVLGEYATLAKSTGESMAESSLRNKRGGANPYNRLYLAWVAHDRAKAGTRRRSGEPLAPDELASIPDASLRHRVVLLMADNHSLRSRVNILETLDGKQVVRIEGGVTAVATPPQPKGACPDLDADDLDAIRDFLDPRKMSARGYRFAEGRGLVAAGGHVIAEPDFIDALAKVVGVRP